VATQASRRAFVLLNKFMIGWSAFQGAGETGHDAPFGEDEETECGHHRQRGEREIRAVSCEYWVSTALTLP
jgi:hypothetical protein